MSKQARTALKKLTKSVERHSESIRAKLTMAGVKPDVALVFSTAKYFRALNKLAKG